MFLVRRLAFLSVLFLVLSIALGSTASALLLDGRTDTPGGTRDASGQTVRVHMYGAPGNCLRVVAAGVQTRNAEPSPPTASGTIVLPAGPAAGNIAWAGLYWETIGNTSPTHNVTLNGSAVAAVSLGVTASPCWPEASAYPFFADVTGLVVAGSNVVAGLDDGGSLAVAPESEGASLVVVYRSEESTACEIIVTDGNDLMHVTGQSFENPLPVSCGEGVAATLTFIGADGQTGIHGYAPDDELWNGVPLSGTHDDWNASDPDAPGAEPDLGWDTDPWAVTTGGGNTAGIDIPLVGGPGDCVNWLATVLEVGVGACPPTPIKESTWGKIKSMYR